MAKTIGIKSPGSKKMMIGIGGMTLAIKVSPPLWLHLTPRITYRTRSLAAPTWTIMANGSIPTNMAGCGVHVASALTGRLIATVIGDGFRHMAAGLGSRMSRGAGRLIIMGDGPMCETAGAGRRSPTSTRDSAGDGDRITWPSSDGEAITTAIIAAEIATLTGRGFTTGATDIWDGARFHRAIGITGRGIIRLALKRSGIFARRGP